MIGNAPEAKRGRRSGRRIQAVLGVCGALATWSFVSGAIPLAGTYPECVDVKAEVLYRNYAYDHVVHVANRCDQAATCDVSTDVNPAVQRILVPPKQEADVLTFRGSPARTFVPRVECRLLSS